MDNKKGGEISQPFDECRTISGNETKKERLRGDYGGGKSDDADADGDVGAGAGAGGAGAGAGTDGDGDDWRNEDESDVDTDDKFTASTHPTKLGGHKLNNEDTYSNHIEFKADAPARMSGNNFILNTEIETTTQAVRHLLATHENDLGVVITEEWESRGSHCHIDVVLCLDNELTDSNGFISTTNFNRLKVRVIPNKYSYLDHMHNLVGALGNMLDTLPNLRKHSLVTTEDMVVLEDPTALCKVDISAATNLSVGYFSYLHTHPIVACTHGLSSSLEWLRMGQAALHG